MTFSDLRAHMGLTQKEMGKRLGVTPQMIGQWERGERMMSGTSMTALVKEFTDIRISVTPEGMQFFPGERKLIPRILLMNSAMMPAPGKYELARLSKDEFCRGVKQAGNLHSYIGYPQNAELIEQWTGVTITVNRGQTDIRPGETMLIMKLKYRADNGTKGKPVDDDDFEFFACTYE